SRHVLRSRPARPRLQGRLLRRPRQRHRRDRRHVLLLGGHRHARVAHRADHQDGQGEPAGSPRETTTLSSIENFGHPPIFYKIIVVVLVLVVAYLTAHVVTAATRAPEPCRAYDESSQTCLDE